MERPVLLTFGFPDTDSPRYRNLVNAYTQEGWEIQKCLTKAHGFFRKHRELLQHYKKTYRQPTTGSYTLLVCFPGYYIMPLAWLLTRFPRKKLIFDAFISVSDTLVSDRKLIAWWNPLAAMYYLVDLISCHLADEVLIDTEAHKQFFMKRFFLSKNRVRVIYVGTRDDLFFPGPKEDLLPEGKCNVLFIGTYIPLQGIETILRAAKLLEHDPDILFTLIGKGQTYPKIRSLAEELRLANVTFLDCKPLEKLPSYLRSCDIALGIFGTSGKADRVIPHKVYDAVACGVPVITARNRAIGERFTDGKEVFLCKPGSAESLAEVVLQLKNRR